MSTATTTSEVYEVCQRLKAAGFPQDGLWWSDEDIDGVIYSEASTHQSWAACPNASECLRFARERWPHSKQEVIGWQAGMADAAPYWVTLYDIPPTGDPATGRHPDPDQAARLALAAALEAEHV